MVSQKVIIRSILLYHFKKGTKPADAYRDIISVFGDDSITRKSAYNWYARFDEGDMTCDDEPRSGRPQEINDDDLLELVATSPSATCEDYAEELNSSKETVRRALHRLGFTSKLQKWVPHILSDANKAQRIKLSKQHLARQKESPFLHRVVTCDEKWVYYKNQTRQRTWGRAGQRSSTVPKRGLTKDKRLLTVFWDSEGVIMHHFMEPGQTINSNVYCDLLDQLKEALSEKRPRLINRNEIIFHQDNARPHISAMTKNKLKEFGWEVLEHPPYSPDLAPTDYHLFRALTNNFRGKIFDHADHVEREVEIFLESRSREQCTSGIFDLVNRWSECIQFDGDYLED